MLVLNPVDRRARRGELLRWFGWLATANMCVLAVVALRYLEVGALGTTVAGRPFGVAMFFAHFLSVAVLALLPVMAPAAL